MAALVASPAAIPAGFQTEATDAAPLWALLEKAAQRTGVEEDLRTVVEHFEAAWPRSAVPSHSLERVRNALSRPWTVPGVGAELQEALASTLGAKGGARYEAAVKSAAAWLELEAVPAEQERLLALEAAWARVADPAVHETELLAALSEMMKRAEEALEPALGALDEKQRNALFSGFAPFCDAWRAMHAPKAEPTKAQGAALQEASDVLVELSVERNTVAAVAAIASRIAEPAFLDTLSKRLARTPETPVTAAGFSGDLRASAGDDPASLVVLAGTGKTTLAGRAALVIDLGGDDQWERAAVVDGPEALISIAVDLRGDDTYASEAPGPAYACGGVALLVDRAGKDVYRSRGLGQAASFLGFALLADLAGDDTYTLEDFGQAYALGGIALLHDAAGDDAYEAWAYAQGAGNGPGFAALVDGGGGDRYLADGHWPDSYGDSGPDVFHGASQGFSSGLRPAIPGGIAALLDLGDGADDYQAGNFSQGGAYFFGFALLYDGGGDDASRGTRYSQGFGVHQAAAVKWDAGGDDRYECRSVANLGMAWDEGVGVFQDDAGDDSYQGGGLSCGGAAQTGIALFVDGGGDDRYVSAAEADSQGGSGASEYHNKPSVGFLLDLGGGKDQYSRTGRKDGERLGDPGCGLFWDANDKTVEKLLRRK